MLKNYKIKAPYFEIGPKCFMWGERMLKLAKAVDKIALQITVIQGLLLLTVCCKYISNKAILEGIIYKCRKFI